MADARHIIVVGAGIVGASIAEALALEGVRVTVIEQATPGGGATAAGMGHVVVMDDSEPQVALTHYSQQLWDARAATLPAAGERMVCGTLWIAADEEEMSEVDRKHAFYSGRGIVSEVLSARALYDAEPMLRPGLAGGLLVRNDTVVYPPPIVAAMLQTVRDRGGTVRCGVTVTSIRGDTVGLDDGTILACDFAVLATGARSASLVADLPIRQRKGHLVITDRYPGFVRHQLVELGYLKSAHSSTDSSVAFNVQPRSTGQLLIGSSRQFGDESAAIDYAILGRMIDRAAEYMPAIAGLSATRVWTGFRAATPDKLPLIGPHPKDERLLIATGHEGLGITTSLGTAALIADHVVGRKPAIAHELFLPSRYQDKGVSSDDH